MPKFGERLRGPNFWSKEEETGQALTPAGESSTVNGSSSDGSLDYLANNYSASSASTEVQAQVTLSQDETPAHDFTSSASTGITCTCMATVDIEDIVPVESDETLLSIYRNQLSSLLPFVIIPAGTTPRLLHATRPFLMKVIRMVASVRHLRLVRGQSRAVMEHISNAILIRSERSLDLLQGILVFLGSYHYHCMAHAQFNNLVRLAVSLAEDLGLSTCPKSQQRWRSQLPLVRAEEPVSRTNEEKRALLGVWYMSSNAGLVVKQLAFTRYTKYMDQCLKDLDYSREHKTDQLVIQLVHIQRLTEKIFYFHCSDSPVDEQLGSPETPTMARLEAFRVELDGLRNALPSNLKSDCMIPQMFENLAASASLTQSECPDFLSCYHNSAYLRIFDPLLAGSHLPDAESQSFASLALSGVPISDVFSHFTAALKAWLENWLAIPVCSYFYMPQPAYVQLVHGAMMLSRWARVAGPSAVKLSSAGAAVLQKEFTAPWQTTPALSGVPSCPDLSLPRPPASLSTQVVSAQILDTLRAKVTAQPNLQIDILGILDTMGTRFEAAKKEIAAAQGLDWENHIWDFAAEHSKMKKARVKKWCEIVAMAADEGRSPLTDVHDSAYEGGGEATGTSGYDWDKMQWESAMFDEILQDIHTGAVFKPVDWNTGMLADL
ncbi:C6 transcription factor protein [Rutstroemia sp. NJR-2017a WRK4]|nr:C6 transcription factor protein [Rutstroemia sp. NJR-2017a WRK4]